MSSGTTDAVPDPLPDNFASQFELIADLAPDRPAVLCGDRTLTWGEFDERADRLAGHLAAAGVREGDRFGLAARNSPEYLVALHALFKIGATQVNINYRYKAGEVRHLLASSGTRGVIADADLVEVVTEAAQGVPACDVLAVVQPGGGFGAEVDTAERLPRRPRGDTEWLLFTGGTTGHPKAVTGSHAERLRAVRGGGFTALGLDPADGPAALRRALEIDPWGPGGVVAMPAPPLMHGTGLYSALGAMAAGSPVALLPGRSTTGADLVAAIERHGVTEVTIVGDAFALRLLDALDAAVAQGRTPVIPTLRRIRSVGAVWSPPVKRRLLAHADLALHDTIAASEGGVYALSVLTRADGDGAAGTFSLAPGARLLDHDDRDIPPGSDEVGLLAAPVVAGAGYEGDAEKTDAAFKDIDGVRYSIPGDMARWGPEGRLLLLGRGSSVINTGGEKVYADEVELVLRDHPAVRDAVVLGVPDPQWGSVVAAVVALDRGSTATEDELAGFVAQRLAGYKKPRRIALVDEVRRLNTGKNDLTWARSRFAAPATR
ncbi:AMP-binding protein [Pseudonocardia lacus]|uniref:AMP-binding protein n=1 Tax=Pseudonocardia lacus TaxID=2835865 RepID=UPI001BDCCCAA|nr:AMP-binding protein [Pseudonocardia lacus]